MSLPVITAGQPPVYVPQRFNQRVEKLVAQISEINLVSQAHLNQFISQFRTTKPENLQNQTWNLCFLLSDVLHVALAQVHEHDFHSKIILCEFGMKFEVLLLKIIPPELSIEEILSQYHEMKFEKERERIIQNQMLSHQMNTIANLKALEANQNRITREFIKKTDKLILQQSDEKQIKFRALQLQHLEKAHQVMMDIQQDILRLQEALHRQMPFEE